MNGELGRELDGEDATIAVGAVFAGRYRIDRVISTGGMGVVAAATDLSCNARVAVKCLRLECGGSRAALARFTLETEVIAKLRSLHTVRLFASGMLHDGSPYLVMELLEGEDLGQRLARGPLPIAEAARWVLQACESLAEAHAAGIVHRDLKPSNLFLARGADGSLLLKVLDFGVAKILSGGEREVSHVTRTSEIVGTPAYMSPQQIEATSSVDARADVWSLGVVLFQLLTGRLPFEASSVPRMFAKILFDDPEPPRSLRAEVPADLEEVVQRCLEKTPHARFESVAELAAALAPFAACSASDWGDRVSAAKARGGALRQEAIGPVDDVTLAATPRGHGIRHRAPARRVSYARSALVLLASCVAGIGVAATTVHIAPGPLHATRATSREPSVVRVARAERASFAPTRGTEAIAAPDAESPKP